MTGKEETQKVLKLNVIPQCWRSTVALVVWTETAVFFLPEIEKWQCIKKKKITFFKQTAELYILVF